MADLAPAGTAPVVLVHGWGGSAHMTWDGTLLERGLTADGREVVGVDLPGHGPAGGSPDPDDYACIAAQLSERLPERLPDRPGLDAVGFSLGGKLLLQIAASEPARFRRLVIAGVGGNLFRREDGDSLAAALVGGVPPDELPTPVGDVARAAIASGNDRAAMAAVIRRPFRPVAPADLAAIRAEVLLVVGDRDVVAGDVAALLAALPDARLVRVPDLDHVGTPRSVVLADAAQQFLRRG